MASISIPFGRPYLNHHLWIYHLGLSWHTNLYGLTCDTIEAYELVIPSGEILEVNASSYPDLFFGLKGGLNNFVSHLVPASKADFDSRLATKGVVTRFTLKSFPQTDVWVGYSQFTDKLCDSLMPFE